MFKILYSTLIVCTAMSVPYSVDSKNFIMNTPYVMQENIGNETYNPLFYDLSNNGLENNGIEERKTPEKKDLLFNKEDDHKDTHVEHDKNFSESLWTSYWREIEGLEASGLLFFNKESNE